MYSYMRGIDTRRILGFCMKCHRLVREDYNARQDGKLFFHLDCRAGRLCT